MFPGTPARALLRTAPLPLCSPLSCAAQVASVFQCYSKQELQRINQERESDEMLLELLLAVRWLLRMKHAELDITV